jgi:mono/diheme cytochrome c family protein
MGRSEITQKSLRAAVFGLSILWLWGCNQANGPVDAPLPGRWYTAGQLDSGRDLFRRHCAGCHGLEAQGTADWRRRDAAGNLPPPPLNGSAHAWHHSRDQLQAYILAGGQPLGGTMPGFANRLDERQAIAVIAYFQSTWDDQTYLRWVSMFPTGRSEAG